MERRWSCWWWLLVVVVGVALLGAGKRIAFPLPPRFH